MVMIVALICNLWGNLWHHCTITSDRVSSAHILIDLDLGINIRVKLFKHLLVAAVLNKVSWPESVLGVDIYVAPFLEYENLCAVNLVLLTSIMEGCTT